MRMDDEFKKEFSEVCKELGCNISTVVTMLGTKMIRERRIPFEVCSDPFYSEANMAHLKRSIAQGSVRISVSGEVIPGAAQRGCPLYLRCSMPDLMR